MKSVIFASSVLGASAGFCCYNGCDNAPDSCNQEGEYCSSEDTCGGCGGEWCGDAPSPGPSPDPSPGPSPDPSPAPSPDPSPDPSPEPSPEPSPAPSPDPSPGPSPAPPAGLKTYCPTADDLTVAYGEPSITDGGWTVNGDGGVASKAAFNLLGGYVEFDIDLSSVDTGVNANIYTISPAAFSGEFFDKNADYCDGAATGSDWCMELDWIEANGHCGGASTIHTIEGPGSDGCTAWGCRVSEHYDNSNFHMKIEYDDSGAWTITRDGQVLSGWDPAPDSTTWDYVKQMQEERGSVIYSSEWTGWVPVEDCGSGGDLSGSSFSISNLVVSGSVVQGPEPTECTSSVSV